MKTLILCDRQSASFHSYDLRALTRAVADVACTDTSLITLDGGELAPCRGCFLCWVKTPGLCSITNDKANALAAQQISADVLILLSEICFGGFSFDIKSYLDRMIPTISPFFEIFAGEMHHKMRYRDFPVIITIGYGGHSSKEHQTFIDLAGRNALNLHPPRHYVFTIKDSSAVKEVLKDLRAALVEVTE